MAALKSINADLSFSTGLNKKKNQGKKKDTL